VSNDLDPVWRALSDPTRRAILDLLRDGPKTTGEIVAKFPEMTRFGVMKHLGVLRDATLVQSSQEGRRTLNRINAVPLRLIYERWVSGFEDLWASKLTSLKKSLEDQNDSDA
jgi:DNA-binding transcriptional ArsR family regulator